MSDEATTPPTSPWSTGPAVPAVPAPPSPVRPLTVSIPNETSLRLLVRALIGGLLAQALFVGQLLGLNVGLWSAFVLATAILSRGRATIDRLDVWLPPAALLFGAFVAIRGDGPLLLFNTLASWALLIASVAAVRGVTVTRGTWRALTQSGAAVGAVIAAGGVRLGGGLRPLRSSLAHRAQTMRVIAGLLLALPLVLVFSALFAAADAVFAAHLRQLFTFDLALHDVVGRAVFAFLAGWLLAGLLLVRWLSDEFVRPREDGQIRRRLGVIEAGIVLVAVDAVFTAFVVLQAAYLFGGIDTLAVSGLTYSEYARRGFFELIAVAGLAGLVILAVDVLIERRTLLVRVAAVTLAVLTGAVLVSALVRLSLYQQAYGWTELRFYALLAIGWLAIGVVGAIGGLVFDRLRLVPRVLVIGALALAVTANVVGPQRFVTEQNVARVVDPTLVPADGWSGLDVEYLYSLGDDAVPPLVAAVPLLAADVRANVERALGEHADFLRWRADRFGWPSFNLARVWALEHLEAAGY